MFKKLFCNHKWDIVSSLSDCIIHEENGKKIFGTRYECKCSKCNKEKIFFAKERFFGII